MGHGGGEGGRKEETYYNKHICTSVMFEFGIRMYCCMYWGSQQPSIDVSVFVYKNKNKEVKFVF